MTRYLGGGPRALVSLCDTNPIPGCLWRATSSRIMRQALVMFWPYAYQTGDDCRHWTCGIVTRDISTAATAALHLAEERREGARAAARALRKRLWLDCAGAQRRVARRIWCFQTDSPAVSGPQSEMACLRGSMHSLLLKYGTRASSSNRSAVSASAWTVTMSQCNSNDAHEVFKCSSSPPSLVVFQKHGRHHSPRGTAKTAIRSTYDLFSHRQHRG